MSAIDRVFETARRENRAALISFLMAGDPTPEATVGLARALEEAGADILELGVPFSDPVADGPVLQRSAARARGQGVDVERVFALVRRIRGETRLALVLFSYLNPLLRHGIARAATEARDSGFDGVLVTDLPPEEAREHQPFFRSAGLDTIFLVSPTSSASRMSAAARLASGFLYVVSRPGTTGTRPAAPADLPETISRAKRAAGPLPLAVGFGIATPQAVREAALLADGVVVGSAIVEAAEMAGSARERAVGEMVRSLALACRRNRSKLPSS